MNLMSRLKRIEKVMNVTDEDVFIHVGIPSFVLYGAEARAYKESETAAGRLQNPHVCEGIGVYRKYTMYLPDDLEDNLKDSEGSALNESDKQTQTT